MRQARAQFPEMIRCSGLGMGERFDNGVDQVVSKGYKYSLNYF